MQSIITSIFFFLTAISASAQKTELALNLKNGEIYSQVMVSNVTIDQDFNGQQINMKMGISGNMTYQVESVSKEKFHIKVAYKSLGMSITMPMQSMVFSSEKDDENDIFSLILSEMKDKPFDVIMSKSGKVLEVNNIENLFSSAFEKFEDLPEAQLAQIKSQLMKAYGEQAFKGNIEMATAIFPEEPVNKEDNWEVKTKLESGVPGSMTSTYTFKGETSEEYVITGVSNITTDDKEAYVENNGMKMKYDMAGDMNSEILVDKESGWIVKSEITQELKGDAYILENPQMPDGMKIPMSMNTEMSITDK